MTARPQPPGLSFRDRMGIRWRHRRVIDPRVWRNRVRFDELIASDWWDLAPNVDELNERYVHYRLQPWERAKVEDSTPEDYG